MPGLLDDTEPRDYLGAGAGAVGRCMGAPVVSRGVAGLAVPAPVVLGAVAVGRVSVVTVALSVML